MGQIRKYAALFATALMVTAFCGCAASGPRYQTPKESASMLAVVRADGVLLKSVDGAKLEDQYNAKLEPGTHTVDFVFNQKFPGYSTRNEAELTYTFIAGQKLSLKKKMFYADDPGLRLIDEANGQELKGPNGASLFTMH